MAVECSASDCYTSGVLTWFYSVLVSGNWFVVPWLLDSKHLGFARVSRDDRSKGKPVVLLVLMLLLCSYSISYYFAVIFATPGKILP